jgi:pimeloyl-ACP methyl ester carboxylesterase
MDAPGSSLRHHQVVVSGSSVHVVEAGDPRAPSFLFLHGWPESWLAWQAVMQRTASRAHAIAIDLPGVGGSGAAATDGTKRRLAETVHALVAELKLTNLTLVGQDVGGMIAYAYLRAYQDIERAVIMDVVIPGVDPWEEVRRNPYIWHFAFHSIPRLPETLVQGHQAVYFDYYFDTLSADATKITPEARAAYVAAYATPDALTAGFGWYRAFPVDADDNRRAASSGPAVTTPLLYVRGARESGDIDAYVRGFRDAGVTAIDKHLIPAAGHFTQEEAPDETWQALARFAGLE